VEKTDVLNEEDISVSQSNIESNNRLLSSSLLNSMKNYQEAEQPLKAKK